MGKMGILPKILQELSDEEKESSNAETLYESDRDLNEENIEVNCISSDSEQKISKNDTQNSFENAEFFNDSDKTTK